MTGPLSEIPPGWLADKAPPLVLDLGCHRGHFLLALALQHPEWNILGVERQSDRVARCRDKIQRLGLANAAALRAEIREFVAALPPGSVAQAHILFPDPWPKRRHEHRRLLRADFLRLLAAALRHGGALRVLTDQPAYAEQARHAAAEIPCLVEANAPEFPPTAFEQKFTARGLAIERLFWIRRDAVPPPSPTPAQTPGGAR